jgi:hypothetical protein
VAWCLFLKGGDLALILKMKFLVLEQATVSFTNKNKISLNSLA